MDNITGIHLFDQKLKKILSSEQVAGDEGIIHGAFDLLLNNSQKEKAEERIHAALDLAEIVVTDLNLGTESVLAIMLKELADNSVLSKEQIEKNYGNSVWGIISGLQNIYRLDTTKYTSNSENFIKLLLTLSNDIRVILIRLGQCIYDIRNIDDFSPEKQNLVTGEISFLYVPITHRIGLYNLKTELEDRVMRFSEPEVYIKLEEKIRETQKDRDRYSSEFIRPIKKRLKENGFDCEIRSRIKSIPSIRRKMVTQKVDFERVYDLFAIRIIINNTVENEKSDCWKVYSLITDIYMPNPRRLRDWISFPKSTGYESLHTTVIGPEGRWVEVQIRTRRMDEIAEKSFAAHWKYKSGGKTEGQTEFYAGIRKLLENPFQVAPGKGINLDKQVLYTDEIFIFTPKGDLKKLRAGYTVLDFAYEIHSDIGSTCTGAIVNGTMVPLRHVLKNGDTVRILTSRNQKPNRDWLEFVKSPRVISRIRHALKMETYKEAESGKEIIKNKVIQMGMEFNDSIINRLVDYFSCENFLDLYQRFGEGKLDPLKIKKALAEPHISLQTVIPDKEENFPERISEVLTGKQDYIVIDNRFDSIYYQFAKCCNPIPGDTIFAFVSVTYGIRIHKTNCSNARQLFTRYPYRILEARWKEIEKVKSFTANLSINGHYTEEIIDKLTRYLMHDLKIMIRSAKLQLHPGKIFTWEIGVPVNSKVQLDELINRVKKIKEVSSVKRIN